MPAKMVQLDPYEDYDVIDIDLTQAHSDQEVQVNGGAILISEGGGDLTFKINSIENDAIKAGTNMSGLLLPPFIFQKLFYSNGAGSGTAQLIVFRQKRGSV